MRDIQYIILPHAGRLSGANPRHPRRDTDCTSEAGDGAGPAAGSGQRLKIKPEGSMRSLPAILTITNLD